MLFAKREICKCSSLCSPNWGFLSDTINKVERKERVLWRENRLMWSILYRGWILAPASGHGETIPTLLAEPFSSGKSSQQVSTRHQPGAQYLCESFWRVPGEDRRDSLLRWQRHRGEEALASTHCNFRVRRVTLSSPGCTLGRDQEDPLFPLLDTLMGPICLFGKKPYINVFWNHSAQGTQQPQSPVHTLCVRPPRFL